MTSLNASLAEAIATARGEPPQPGISHAVAGGDINTCLRFESAATTYFVKTNTHPFAQSMFAAEAQLLTTMARNNCIRVPVPLVTGAYEDTQYLILEYLRLGGPADWQAMGRQLAELHRHDNPRYGWQCDNFIGTSPQANGWLDSWTEFFWQRRLRPQLHMAAEAGHSDVARCQARVHTACMRLLEDHRPMASLVHGDLWAGNAGFDAAGDPVIYDPAGYYGDREVDLALTELFGGFAPDFYRGYDSAWPRPPAWRQRTTLYNLYHLLNHLNLFGSGYLNQCLRAIGRLPG